jgi:uncharacterized protein YegJ (DUF2314 family)
MGHRVMRHVLLASLSLACAASFAQSVIERAKKDELVFMRDEEPAMRRAFQVARETLEPFLETAKRGASNHTGFALKVAISQGDDTEYFWVNNFQSKDGGQFEGEINNEPRMVKSVRLGQRYVFSRDQVVDWMYLDKSERRMVGNFTLCALLTKQSPRELEATIRRFKLDCSRVIE